jgi:hypothetical protein
MLNSAEAARCAITVYVGEFVAHGDCAGDLTGLPPQPISTSFASRSHRPCLQDRHFVPPEELRELGDIADPTADYKRQLIRFSGHTHSTL